MWTKRVCTANARALGGTQADAFRSHRHSTAARFQNALSGGETVPGYVATGLNTHPVAPSVDGSIAGGAETRPANVAYYPRVHA